MTGAQLANEVLPLLAKYKAPTLEFMVLIF